MPDAQENNSRTHLYILYTAQGDVIKKRTLDAVPVTRNRITSYTGPLFSEGEGTITQSGFSFTVNGEWGGEDEHEF